MEITAGVFGTIKREKEETMNFLLHEYEIRNDNLLEKVELAHPVHRGIRIYLQLRGHPLPYGKILAAMKEVHESLLTSNIQPRLICPGCLGQEDGQEGFYNMSPQLSLDGDPRTMRCFKAGHQFPSELVDAFTKTVMVKPYSCAKGSRPLHFIVFTPNWHSLRSLWLVEEPQEGLEAKGHGRELRMTWRSWVISSKIS